MSLITTNYEFLKGVDDTLYDLASKLEDNVDIAPDRSSINGHWLFEKILDISFERANLEEKTSKSNYYERIQQLYHAKAIDFNDSQIYDRARRERNKIMHKHDYTVVNALNFNRILFKLVTIFYKKFYDPYFEIPKYVVPEPPEKVEEDIGTVNETKEREFIVPDFELSKMNGSYLINELSKLSISSKHSIEGSSGLDDFKEYMHVERDIQTEFFNTINNIKDKDSNHLILLAGSVGDGKSHLLSYMSSKYPEIMNSFKVHNDATESFGPNLTANDTLREVLKPFNDQNIDTSKDKIILAINLGIIRGLLDDEKFNEEFSKLKLALDESDIFNSDFVDRSENNFDYLDIINFSDNQLYELNEEKVQSKFINILFDKIADDSPNNPFYAAYLKDKNEGITTPVTLNYEMFMMGNVREKITQILLKYIIKNKKLLSTREIINFIYEVLVPPIIKSDIDITHVDEYIEDLLPVLLFNSEDRSRILKEIVNESPVNVRNKFLDEFLISLNTLEIATFFNRYFENYDEIDFLKNYLLGFDYPNLDSNEKQNIKDKLVFFALFFGNETVLEAFEDKRYDEFLKYLYYYNYSPKKLNHLFNIIKKSIFKWRGSVKKDYILLDEVDNFRLGKRLNVEFKNNKACSDENNKNRFKTDIQFNFLANEDDCEDRCTAQCNFDRCVKLNIDYFLFDSIVKISEGYQPNKIEKQNLMIFNDFINLLIQKNKSKQILISDDKNNEKYKFNLSSGLYYNFERE